MINKTPVESTSPAPSTIAKPWMMLLTEAADLMEEHGYAKDYYVTVDGRMCVQGAIYMAATGKPDPAFHTLADVAISSVSIKEAFDKLAAFIVGHRGFENLHSYGSANMLADWNNATARTQEEVVSALRECAALAA